MSPPTPTPPAPQRPSLLTRLGVALTALIFLLASLLTALALVGFGPGVELPLAVLGVGTGLWFVVRLSIWWFYRPHPASDPSALPALTVVMPAFNEGPLVAEAIDSILRSDYPPGRLRVIAVDDGSTDDTGAHLEAAARLNPERVTVLRLPNNVGKRHALLAGFTRVTSPLLATIDSDSLVAPDALRHLVAPLIADPKIGAVAGQVLVLNRDETLLTRMLAVRYRLGFDVVRGYQSVLRTVWCCPGALQAYRRDTIAPHFDAWANQHFLGARCTNGDDHCMTNLVLSLGQDAVFQSSATIRTKVPAHYRPLTRMLVRWGRSATREGLRALAFSVPRALTLGPWRGPLMLADALFHASAIATRIIGPIVLALSLVRHPSWIWPTLAVTTLFSVVYALAYLRGDRSWRALYGIPYAWFALFCLLWVRPYATLTVRRNGWMTRRTGPKDHKKDAG